MTLTTDEYNGLNKIAKGTKCDCWFFIAQDEITKNDYIYDLESGNQIDLQTGVSQLSEAITDPLEDYGLTEDECKAVESLFEKLKSLSEINYEELANDLIDRLCEIIDVEEVIEWFLDQGYNEHQLIALQFDKNDIKRILETIEEEWQ